MAYMTHDLPLKVSGPDGTSLYVGIGPLGFVYMVTMVSLAAAAGQVIMLDPTNTIVPRTDYLAADTVPKQVLRGLIATVTAASGCTIGVAIDTCASDANGIQIRVAGAGSLVATNASGAGTIGQMAVRTGTTGQVVSAAQPGTGGLNVGSVAKTTITGGTGTKIGVLVNPW